MRVFIQTHGLILSREDRDHIRQRLHQALARFGQKAMGASLHLSDTNGPRGGNDKDCHLVVELEDTTTVVRDRGGSIRSLVDRAVHRAMHSVGRQLKEIHSRTRRAPNHRRDRQEPTRNRRMARAWDALPDAV